MTERKRSTDMMKPSRRAVVNFEGRTTTLLETQLYRRSDGLVKQFPELFEKASTERPDVEETTARPGRKRGTAAAA